FFQAEDGIRDLTVTGVQTCALPIFADSIVVEIGDVDVVPGIDGNARWSADHGRGGRSVIAAVSILRIPGNNRCDAGRGYLEHQQIGRASCRERGEISEGVVGVKERK